MALALWSFYIWNIVWWLSSLVLKYQLFGSNGLISWWQMLALILFDLHIHISPSLAPAFYTSRCEWYSQLLPLPPEITFHLLLTATSIGCISNNSAVRPSVIGCYMAQWAVHKVAIGCLCLRPYHKDLSGGIWRIWVTRQNGIGCKQRTELCTVKMTVLIQHHY